jgi:hypothetical protein
MSRGNRLSPLQLCDLLNYVLGVPVKLSSHVIYPAISSLVIISWSGQLRDEAERWCEWVLDRELVIQARRHPREVPLQVLPWVPIFMRKVMSRDFCDATSVSATQ